MTTDDRLRGLLTDWLEDQPTRAPDQLLHSVITDLQRTPQRARWRVALRRLPMFGSNTLRFFVAVGVVALAAVIGLGVWAGRPSVSPGGPAPTASPPATQQPLPTQAATLGPTLSPTPTPRVLTLNEEATEAGTYVTEDPFPVRVTFTLPEGWQGFMGGPYGVFVGRPGDTVEVVFSIFDKVYADPCDHDQGLLDPLPGSSVDDLATALASLPSVDVTAPTPTTLGGYRGQQLTLTAPDSFLDCTLAPGEYFRVWELPLGATLDMQRGQRNRLLILDVDGQRLVIDMAETPASSAQGKADAQAIIDSISIEPGN